MHSMGIDAAALLDPSGQSHLTSDQMRSVQRMISGGLLWVFVAILIFAILQLIATAFMPPGRSTEPLTRARSD